VWNLANEKLVLMPTFSMLYKKHDYLIPITVIHNHIYEYDIRSANTSVLANSDEFDQNVINKLNTMNKDSRNRSVGLLIQQNKAIGKIIANGIIDAKYLLFTENKIQDGEVVSIKNDAVFIAGRKLKYTDFRSVHFRIKGNYNLYINLNGIEFYYSVRTNQLDIKGIADDIISTEDHQMGMIVFLKKIFCFIVREQQDKLREYLLQFVSDYKSLKLPHQYYREFNEYNFYRTKYYIPNFEFNLLYTGEKDKDMINGIYNYTKFILPLIRKYI